MIPLKVTFHLDGTGVCILPGRYHFLDGLLCWAQRVRLGLSVECDPAEVPEDTEIPLKRVGCAGEWVWAASALYPDEDAITCNQFMRRRTDIKRAELVNSETIPLVHGPTKNIQKPRPSIKTLSLHAYCVGDMEEIRLLAGMIRWIGASRTGGMGAVVGTTVEAVKHDFSCIKDGLATRYLPDPFGARLVRCRPPYWHMLGRTQCLSPGESV